MDKSRGYNHSSNNEYSKCEDVCDSIVYSTIYKSNCELFRGRTSEIEIRAEDNDIRLDLVVDRKKISKLWGHVKDDKGNCVENALITLLKPKYIRGSIEYFPIATTLSDCMGFYQFEIDNLDRGLKYRVSISKS